MFPDYQGVGIGSRFNDAIATMYVKEGYRFLATLSQPQLINSRKNNPKWRLTSIGRKSNGGKNRKSISSMCNSSNRITTSWEFKK